MNVLDRLDEMRLTENKVNLCRFFDFYGDHVHLLQVAFRNRLPVSSFFARIF
jgi:hypothetical protein